MQQNLNSTVNNYFYFNVSLNDALNFNNNTHLTARMKCGLPQIPILFIWPGQCLTLRPLVQTFASHIHELCVNTHFGTCAAS